MVVLPGRSLEGAGRAAKYYVNPAPAPLPAPDIVVGAFHGRRGTRAAARGSLGATW